jgi:protein-L-isoaspartate(D-aspartate) O-methyltransferase
MTTFARFATLTFLLAALLAGGCRPERDDGTGLEPEPDRWSPKRKALVELLKERGVENPAVVHALLTVPRHRFVPPDQAEFAYENMPLSIGEGQTISSPFIVGFMTQILRLDGTEKVLEIGTGSGYQAAVLAEITPEVFSIEIRPKLADSAKARLAELGYESVRVRCGDGYKGWPEEAPFHAIIVTAAPEEVPEALVEQLAPGGRLIVPVGPQSEHQELILVRKDTDGRVSRDRVLPVRFVPMIRGD